MLELYQAEDCPYSAKVRQTMQELGVSYVVHNPRSHDGEVKNEQTFDRLRTVGGKDQIPCLVDTDAREVFHESDEIVAYLREQYG